MVIFGPAPPNPQAPQGCGNGESGGDARAGSGSVGLMQINVAPHLAKVARVVGQPVTYEQAALALRYPDINLAVGFLVYEAAGYTWGPWSCRP